jgi:hypothetical protein
MPQPARGARRRPAGSVQTQTVSKKSNGPNGGPASSIVVYVHGINQTLTAEALKVEWDLALFGHDVGERSRMAYWKDLVPIGSVAGGGIGAQSLADGEIDIDAILQSAGVSPDDAKARAFAETMLARMEQGGAAGGIRGKFLPLPRVIRKPIARAFIEAFIGDAAAYFFRPGMRQKIQQRLIEQLPIDGTPVTIVAHSQGSIIAYEVLSALKQPIALDALITVGSPLGVGEIQDFLEPQPAIPASVRRWFNFADLLDPVALDKGLANEFFPADGGNLRVQDEVVANTNPNPHSSVGYLANPRVRVVVKDEMRMDIFAPFVLARDVAEKLGAPPEERHSVLIEAVEPGFRAPYESADDMRRMDEHERDQLRQLTGSPATALTLQHRIETTGQLLRSLLPDPDAAQIDPLRRFISARLTGPELRLVAQMHQELRVYTVWQSSRKSKLTDRSMRVLKADAALTSFGADGSDITWAVLDTGVRGDHPHFMLDPQTGQSVVQAVWDCTRQGPPRRIEVPKAKDRDGHGTHVAGIIAGKAPDASKLRGVAPRTKLVVYKVLNDQGQGEDAWIIKALDHIAQQNENTADGLAIHGLNLSLGGPFDTSVYGCGFSPICMELRRLWRSGVLLVVACGNEGRLQVRTPDGDTEINSPMSIGDPANLEDCIAVGSVHSDQPHLYGISSFSSRGPTADGRAKPDVVAPGERICSANSRYRGKDDLYFKESGTSMAAPHVSGLLAAFLSVRREFRGRPDEVKKILLASCTDLGRDRYHQGAGVPNLMQMLLAV